MFHRKISELLIVTISHCIVHQNAKSEYDRTDRLLDRMDRINDPATFVPVIEFKQICIDPNPLSCGESYMHAMGYMHAMEGWCYMEGQDYKKNPEDEAKGVCACR